MKRRKLAVSAIVILLLVGVAAVALAKNEGNPHSGKQGCGSYTVGESLTVGTMKGHFVNSSNHSIKGKSNGTFTFQVTQTYVTGCVISITSGTFYVGKTKYTTTGGTVLMSKGGHNGNGWGSTSGGSFLVSISALHGNSTKASAGSARIDFKVGSSEFQIQLGHSGH